MPAVDDEEPLVRLATKCSRAWATHRSASPRASTRCEEFGANPGRFDVILTDERMPGVTGSAIIREVRRIKPSIPILLMSGFVEQRRGAGRRARSVRTAC